VLENVNVSSTDKQALSFEEAIVDSGASVNTCGNRNLYVGKFKTCHVKILCANNLTMIATEMGDIPIFIANRKVWLRNVLYIPNAPTLISVNQVTRDGKISFWFKKGVCYILDSNDEVFHTIQQIDKNSDKLYKLLITIPKQVVKRQPRNTYSVFAAYHSFMPRSRSIRMIHLRYNHVTEYACKKIDPKAKGSLDFCDACAVGGLPCKRYKKFTSYDCMGVSNERKNKHEVFERTGDEFDEKTLNINYQNEKYMKSNVDYCSHMQWDMKTSPISSVRDYKYAHIGVCRDTKVTIALLAVNKSDFAILIRKWICTFKNFYGRSPAHLHFDQGTEYKIESLIDDLEKWGTKVTFSSVASSNQNAQVERKIAVVWMAMLKVLAYSGVPFQFWCFALDYVTKVGNNIPSRTIQWESPNSRANLPLIHSKIFVFGCEAYFVNKKRMGHEAKAKRGVFLGISDDVKGWYILDIETRKVIVTRDVVMNELKRPFVDVMKPCLIMLKFGTWPKLVSEETVSIENKFCEHDDDLDTRNGGVDADIPSSDQFRKSPNYPNFQKDFENSITKDDSTKNTVDNPETKTQLENDPEIKIENPFTENKYNEFSPIDKTNNTTNWDPTLDLTNDFIAIDLNLNSPILGKTAKKKFKKIQDNYYYKSNSNKRLEPYERGIRNRDQEMTITPFSNKQRNPKRINKKTKLVTPIPEEMVDGKPMWNFRKITNMKEGKGGKEDQYRVRWEGDYKDTWEPKSSFESIPDAIEEYHNKFKNNRIDKKKNTIIIKSRKETKMNITDHAKENFKNSAKLRRSNRIRERREIAKMNLAKTPWDVTIEDVSYDIDLPSDLDDLDEVEEINLAKIFDSREKLSDVTMKASTEFPLPPQALYENHIHMPKEVDLEKILGVAIEEFTKFVDDYEVKPEHRHQMLRGNRVDEFMEAEARELKELDDNNTFKLVLCPEDRKRITCRWVYDIKRDHNNEIVRFKARLVVQGFKQIEGVDFQKTFSSVAQMRSFRTVLALSTHLGMKITQYDISNAFLNAELEEDIYMSFPPGYNEHDGDPKLCWKLLKGLYGLKQASRLWRELLVGSFEKIGLKVCKTESGILHMRGDNNDLCLINLHVDDYLICTKDEVLRKKIEVELDKLFIVKPLGELKLFLGMVCEIKENTEEIKVHQGPYLERVLDRYGQKACKTAKTPAEPSAKISILDSPLENEEKPKWPYMSVGGSLLYAAIGTRPDICQRVIQLARYNNNPGETHVKAQKHILKYVKGTKDLGIIFRKQNTKKVRIVAFCDSDWGGCSDTRRSTVGFVIHLSGGPISWKSQLKKTLALSSCEAEFMALTELARELMWLIRFLTEIGIDYFVPEIYCDSQSAIYWSEDPVQHQRNKHVEIKYYYIRDLVSRELVKVYKINTKHNISDLMTKPATTNMMSTLCKPMMGMTTPILEE